MTEVIHSFQNCLGAGAGAESSPSCSPSPLLPLPSHSRFSPARPPQSEGAAREGLGEGGTARPFPAAQVASRREGAFDLQLGRWVGFPAPRGLRGPQFPLGGGGAPATGLSVRRAAAPPEGEGRAAPGLGKRHGRPLSPAPAGSTELGESRLDPRDCCSPSGRLPSPYLEEEFTRLSVTYARVLKRLCSLTAVVAFSL